MPFTPTTKVILHLIPAIVMITVSALFLFFSSDEMNLSRDFGSYYKAAKLYGKPASTIYDFRSDDDRSNILTQARPEFQALTGIMGAAASSATGIDVSAFSLGFTPPYFYPPVLASILRPLTAFPETPEALRIWFLVLIASACVIPYFVFLLTTVVLPEGDFIRRWCASLFASAILLPVILDNLFWRQMNIVVADFILLLFILERRYPAAGGAMWAVGCAFKMSPAFLSLGFLRRRALPVWMGAAVAAFVVFLITLPGGGFRYWLEFADVVFRISAGDRMMMGIFPAGMAGNHSIKGMFFRLLPGTPGWGSLAYAACAGGFFLAGAWAAYKEKGRALTIPMLAALMLLVSPMTWQGHFVVLAPAVAVLVSRAFREGESARRRFIYAAGAGVPIGAALLPHVTSLDPGLWMLMGFLNSGATISLMILFAVHFYFSIQASDENHGQQTAG